MYVLYIKLLRSNKKKKKIPHTALSEKADEYYVTIWYTALETKLTSFILTRKTCDSKNVLIPCSSKWDISKVFQVIFQSYGKQVTYIKHNHVHHIGTTTCFYCKLCLL